MTWDDKLRKALQFLLTSNAKGASFDYYDDKAKLNRYQDWLFNFFEREGIPENEYYPIVTELAKRDLIDVSPPETKITTTPPNQIKISFRGMAFLEPGMGKDQAKALNSILKELMTPKQLPLEELKQKVEVGNQDFYRLLEILHAEGHITHYGNGIGHITNTGFTFITNGGYVKRILQDKIIEQSDTISELTIQNLKLQNKYLPHVIKQTKNKGLIDLLLFLGGAAVTYGGVFLTNKLQETRESKKQSSETKIVLAPTTSDTTIKILQLGLDSVQRAFSEHEKDSLKHK